MKTFLALCLFLSLCLNVYLWQQHNPPKTSPQLSTSTPENEVLQQTDSTPSKVVATRYDTLQHQAIGFSEEQKTQWQFLLELASQQKYDELILPLQAYLQRYPNDHHAWMLEADVIYFTEPLNTAIVHYYTLLAKGLPEDLQRQAQRTIEDNTSRVIKRFSQDKAWELLATFLEPLLQIDPLNSRYILALARAYGMLQQTSLMENTLAALPFDDHKAQRLRHLVYSSPAQQQATTENSNDYSDEYIDDSNQNPTIVVASQNNKLIVDMKIVNRDALMLIDTGASTTAISEQLMDNIAPKNKRFLGLFTVQTAGGSVLASLYQVTQISIEQVTLNNVSVLSLPNDVLTDFDGLLGMNVLQRFDLRFDPLQQRMTLVFKQP